MSARPLACRTKGCPGVLGWVRDGVLTVGVGVRVCFVPSARRCTAYCPACGGANDWPDGPVVVPPRKPKAA